MVCVAVGFTGRLVAEYMHNKYGPDGDIKWAMAGRSMDKLESVCSEMGISGVPLVVADATDKSSLAAMSHSARVVLSTVGPYQLYGNELLDACVAGGTDYVDLCGEPAWMHQMIQKHQQAAMKSGSRIVFSCGFDSIPFDMGVFHLQQHALATLGRPCARVRARVRRMKGTFSGGTVASFRETLTAARHDKQLISILRDPFALTPGFRGPDQPNGSKPLYDEVVGSWVTPFVMASINTKNVHRSNFLLNCMYGGDFKYDEMLMTGGGEQGEVLARRFHEERGIEASDVQPGDGPDRAAREAGLFDVMFVGESEDGQVQLRTAVQGDMDPGYGSTSKMVAESAICMAKNPSKEFCAGGVWTCAPAMGQDLINRLEANAGLSFNIES